MKKLMLMLALMLTTLTGRSATDLDQLLPSNWGGWQNLTYGITNAEYLTSYTFPMQVETAGQAIHLIWWEKGKDADGLYRLYYRRSTDLGRTWEDAKIIGTSHEELPENGYGNQRWMTVSGNYIHILFPDFNGYESELNYIRSIDGGNTFTTTTLRSGDAPYYSPHIECDGQTVAISITVYNNNGLRVISSLDGGETFNDTLIVQPQRLVDLKVQGNNWALLGYGDGKIYHTTSSDGGKNYTTQNIARKAADDNYYADFWTPFTYSHMAMDGNNINVIYMGSLSDGDPAPWDDMLHTIFQRSTDGGKTWSEPKYLPGSCGVEPNIISAKGNSIYVLTTTGTGADGRTGRDATPTLFYSHDGGNTWTTQKRGFEAFAPSACTLTIAPDDPNGQHVYLTGQRAFYLESRDGFRTVSRNFFLGSQSNINRGGGNNALSVIVDEEGTEHWFMQYSPADPSKAEWDEHIWNIYHRRAERPAAADNNNMAYDISKTKDTPEGKAINNVIIPMTSSLEATAEAITVECWVRPDQKGFQIASLNNTFEDDNGSTSRGGWYISVGEQWEGKLIFEAGINCEKSVEDVGVSISTDFYRYATNTWGLWHHVAITYDSNIKQDNFRLYVDGILIDAKTDAGKIIMGNKAICIGRVDDSDAKGLIDNFAIYSRALTAEEIRGHIYNTPDATDNDCRMLLTFDGTLRDMSQYQNDAVPLLTNILQEHDGIRAPHTQFTLTKDVTGQTVYANDVTPDGQTIMWVYPDKNNPGQYITTYDSRHLSEDYSEWPGIYTYWMVASGTGDCNACASASHTITVGGLSRVYPDIAGQAPGVKLRIEGGYTLNYDNQPKVVLKQGGTEIEGQWDIEYGYESSKIESSADIAPATFNLETAPIGCYDVIVGTDTLYQAFTLETGEEPDVWMQINSRELMLWNKYQVFTIDYGNRSNVAAYNTPMFIIIPDRHGTIDVELGFDFDLCDPALDDDAQKLAEMLGEYLMAYDEETKDSIRIYSFMIPYIAPNSTYQRTFRMVMKNRADISTDEIAIGYWLEQPWGAYESHAAMTRAPYTLEQGECFAAELGRVAFETAIGFIPGASCLWSIGKNGYSTAMGAEGKWSTFFTNTLDVVMNCAEEAIPGAHAAQCAWKLASLAYKFYGHHSDISAMRECLNGDPNSRKNRGVGGFDPNEMIGPYGFDENAHYIKPIHNMAYTITFENKSTATAPANEVFVTDSLDLSKFDATTFGFSSFGWADTTFVVGSNTKEFTRDIKYNVKGNDILVRVNGQFDPKTGIVNWSFVSMDPDGTDLDDVMNGFLLQNDDNHVGEGFVSFNIEHKPNPSTGSNISNFATIIFDANEPITTNTYVNTFDTDYPTSHVSNIEEKDGKLIVSIEGSDATSGIDFYDLYVFKNGGDAELVAAGVSVNEQVTIPYDADTNYAFCSLATDHVGWNEPKELKAEVTFTPSGINTIVTEDANWTVYAINGKRVAAGKGRMNLRLPIGVYIVKSGKSVHKLIVK